MITTTVAGRTWHFTHALLRPSAEHNESKWGRTGGTGHPMSVALAPDEILFVVSRGSGHNTADWGRDILCRIGKMTIDEDHIGDFARGGLTWPVGLAVGGDGRVYCSDEYMHAILIFDPDAIQRFPEFDEDGEEIGRWGERGSARGRSTVPPGLSSTPTIISLWWTAATTVSNGSPKMASSYPPGEAPVAAMGSSTGPGESPSTQRGASTSRTGVTAGCRSSPRTAPT